MKEFNLEIGPGYSPFIRYLRPDLVLSGMNVYLEKSVHMTDIFTGIWGNTKLIRGDGCTLPFAEASVGTIYMQNVLGSLTPNLFERDWDPEIGRIYNICRECRRVCKRDGKVVIVETATPPGLPIVTAQFSKQNFILMESYKDYDLNKVFQNPFGKEQYLSSHPAYSLVFQKR